MKYILTFFFIGIMTMPEDVLAARLHFGSSQAESGEKMVLYVDAKNPVNAFEVTVQIPKTIRVSNLSDGNSVIKFWTTAPSYDASEGTISFSGIVPGGFKGEYGTLISFDVQALQDGTITFENTTVLLNDSLGSADSVTFNTVLVKQGEGIVPVVQDDEMPEHFTPIVVKDPLLYDGKAVLVFKTEDKQSGISRYEIIESKNRKIDNEKIWEEVESPYVLKDQAQESYIHIRAIDHAGNIREELVYPQSFIKAHKDEIVWGIIILLILAVFSLWVKRRAR